MPKDVLYGKTLRKSFARTQEIREMPNLLEIQKSSYKWFLETGLREVFKDVDSVTDYSGNLELSFIDYSMNEKPKYDEEECKARDATYAAPLKVRVRLRNKETEEIKEQEIFMGDFPLMTDGGTFIINGAERVIVSQIVRSPGVYFDKTTDKAMINTYAATVIPYHGAWLEYETDANDVFYVRIDKNRKLPITWFIKAMGAYKADNPNTWLSCIPDMTTGVVTNEQIKENLIGAGNNVVTVEPYQNGQQMDFSWNSVPQGIRQITEDTRQELEKISGVEKGQHAQALLGSRQSVRSVRVTWQQRLVWVSMVKRTAPSRLGPSAASYRRGSWPRKRATEFSGFTPRMDRAGPVIPRSVINPVPWGRICPSAVGTWVWVPHTACTRPSRYQAMAPFSLVASAWKSTKSRSAWAPSPARISSARRKGESRLASS